MVHSTILSVDMTSFLSKYNKAVVGDWKSDGISCVYLLLKHEMVSPLYHVCNQL